MSTNKEIIEKQVAGTIADMFPRTNDLLNEDSYGKPLTGEPIYLEAFEMVYVFLEIEKRMGVSFGDDGLRDYNFNTVERIAERICEKCSNDSA